MPSQPPEGAGRNPWLLGGAREIYLAYRDRIAGSQPLIPAAETESMRTMNTIARLAVLAGEIRLPSSPLVLRCPPIIDNMRQGTAEPVRRG